MNGIRGTAAAAAVAVALAGCRGEREVEAVAPPPADTIGAPGTTTGTSTGVSTGAPVDTTTLSAPPADTAAPR